ncbi:unnamed protein product [Rotaria sordida]|uniref:Uncharacterized protein n=1 Tax=Rotaria sordida TaxID=392033 RepID=A0A814WV93_9BILA|nr:unnamed protein product [Rotaria sordida]CAF1285203.1 unnamed protein product [Rotaria sordida]CAF3714738.1 unnamed protein product [Rotaria sordida]CAF3752705.1 unnamed protein product [Rotaria sordida]
MFGLLAALNSLPKQREGREALKYENYIRTGQEFPLNRIYRESSIDKRTRKELASIRYKERLQEQIKFVRLMKKLLIKIDHETINNEIDDELEQMRNKVIQLEMKVEKAAHAKNINCEDMFNMDKPDDDYDIELEQMIRNVTLNVSTIENINSKKIQQTSNIINEKFKQVSQSCGDNVNIQTSDMNIDNSHVHGDQILIERIRKKDIK